MSITCRRLEALLFFFVQLHAGAYDVKCFFVKDKVRLHAQPGKISFGDAALAEGDLTGRDLPVVDFEKLLLKCHICRLSCQWTSSSSGFTWTMQCLMFGFWFSRR
jgi:hypothetical protein